MKAEINEHGVLTIYAENKLESFALDQWHKENINGCTLQFKDEHPRCFLTSIRYPKITLFERVIFKIKLFLYR
jgi:hypothetical protein